MLRLVDDVLLLRPGDDSDLLGASGAQALDQVVEDRAAADFEQLFRALERLEPRGVAGRWHDSDDPRQLLTGDEPLQPAFVDVAVPAWRSPEQAGRELLRQGLDAFGRLAVDPVRASVRVAELTELEELRMVAPPLVGEGDRLARPLERIVCPRLDLPQELDELRERERPLRTRSTVDDGGCDVGPFEAQHEVGGGEVRLAEVPAPVRAEVEPHRRRGFDCLRERRNRPERERSARQDLDGKPLGEISKQDLGKRTPKTIPGAQDDEPEGGVRGHGCLLPTGERAARTRANRNL